MKKAYLFNEGNQATYCPEDDKLRLYVGRVPREEYEALRAEGWTSTPKQSAAGQGEFAAVWTPSREDTALAYAGVILDEDAGPADRAADRAERFAGYRDGNLGRAEDEADRFDSGPQAHGRQSYAAAVRAADRHDRHAGRAVNAWDKADYWTSRTAGVISHALHKAAPGVRMGRIKTLEAELRQAEQSNQRYAAHFRMVERVSADPAGAAASLMKRNPGYFSSLQEAEKSLISEIAGHGKARNPLRPEDPPAYDWEHARQDPAPTLGDYAAFYLSRHAAPDSPEWEETGSSRTVRHLQLRLAYERQMLEAAGGRAAHVEMVKGGLLGGRVIAKVNKSAQSGRVVSVSVIGPRVDGWAYRVTNEPGTEYALYQIKTERLAPGAYAPPTDTSLAKLAEFEAAKAAALAAHKAKVPPCPLVNPTPEEAQRLQDVWNAAAFEDHKRRHLKAYGHDYAEEFKPSTAWGMPQAEYSARSKGTYARVETVDLTGGGLQRRPGGIMDRPDFPPVAKVRQASGDGSDYGARRVVFITDKPAKAFPAAVWQDPRPAAVAAVMARAGELQRACGKAWISDLTPEENELFNEARRVGLAYCDSQSQFGVTQAFKDILHAPAIV